MATQRAIDARAVLRSLIAQTGGEARRLRDTVQSLVSHANHIINDLDAQVSEVLVESASGGETTVRVGQPPAGLDLAVKVNGVAVEVAGVDLDRAVVTLAPLSNGDSVVATYTHVGLRNEMIELYRVTGESVREVLGEINEARTLIAALAPFVD